MTQDRTPRVCTSAGHGLSSRTPGRIDPGAGVVGPGNEADVVLSMAKKLDADYAVLFRGLPGSYHMLRNAGVYYKADNAAASHACDTFNELHTDASKLRSTKDGKEMGVSVLYDDRSNLMYASRMAAAIAEAAGIPNRGANRRTDLAVLDHHPGMKSVLIEMFFGSDADDVAAYKAHYYAVEIAILNTNLERWGLRRIRAKTPPRKWSLGKRLFYRANRFRP